ncbi:hypothetical protein LSH36_367g03005 [Paralvinella palmiformis]|uniref:Sugar phosphate transporter domain-containing protein n=1 Tax=Paralvinella palmiformis TaxID=53620 RepID=A0AAD9JEA1_9ANNE|nr:hypothetical protein LSH36_367g03005 [Paralvinella palmiformis]
MSFKLVTILAVIAGYCTVSITLVFANKFLVGSQKSAIDVSLFVVWIQCIVTVLFQTGINAVKAGWTRDWSFIYIEKEIVSSPILCMTVSFVCMLSFNNLCLRHVDVSFYQVARSMTIIFVVIFTVTILHHSVSWRVIICCGVVATGFFLGIDQEQFLGTLSIKGVIYGVLSSVFVALNGVFIKRALDVVDSNSYKVTYYSNINACVLFIPLLLFTGQFYEAAHTFHVWGLTFWCLLFSTGILCFLIAWIGGVQIHLTSTLTHHIIANTKSVLQTLIAVLYYHEVKSFLWWVSVLLVVGGAFSYTMVRIQEDQDQKAKVQIAVDDIEKGQPENLNNNKEVENI